ncbi:hypothetical protein P9112_013946 [Eukaryota sp. TZLM1-RC]
MDDLLSQVYDICQHHNLTHDFRSSKPLKEQTANDVTAPLHHLSYDDQLTIKRFMVTQALTDCSNKLRISSKAMPPWTRQLTPNTPICEISHVVEAPEPREAYRNKCEFSFGLQEGEAFVGFQGGPFKHRRFFDYNSMLIPNEFKQIAKLVHWYINLPQIFELFKPWDQAKKFGYFRTITCRISDTGKLLIMFVVSEKDYKIDGQLCGQVAKLKHDLVKLITTNSPNFELVTTVESKPLTVDFTVEGVLYLNFEGVSVPSADNLSNFEVIYGRDHIVSSICGLNFDIGIDAFFQVNKAAAELLYKQAIDWCFQESSTESDLFLDVCCGTGTIGLTVAKNRNTHVIGVDICETAVENANKNAKDNGISKAQFHSGPAENVLGPIVSNFLASNPNISNISAIVDPPRGGLHKNASLALRKTKELTKFVYIACKVTSLADCLPAICRRASHYIPGIPFKPTKACIVDLFPGTPHCECLILFERISLEEAMTPDPGLGEDVVCRKRKRSQLEVMMKRKNK